MNRSKIEFRISKVLFPKNGQLELGEYSIISCWLVREISGQFIEINPTYKTFSLLSYTPVIFNEYDTYVATVEPKQTQYGISYNLIEIEKDREEMTEGDKRAFLEMVLTPLQVDSLYATYMNPYDLIAKKDKEKLCMVKGIGEKSVNFLFKKYDENLKYSRLMVELKEFGLSKAMMDKLLFTYKDVDVVIEKVKENPYILADEVSGIGFKKADALAINAGMPKNSPKRLEAFFQFFLTSIAEEGNSWIKPKVLFGQIEDGLGVKFEDDIIRQVLYSMNEKGILSWNEDKTKMFLTKYLKLEEDIYKEICRLQKGINKYKRNQEKENRIINTIQENIGFELTEEQKRAVDIILDNNISVLSGSAGCVDKDTEFFNGIEWKKISDYNKEDKVLQFDTFTKEASLVTPLRYIKEPCDKMYHFKSKYGVDQCLSPEHRVLYTTYKNPNKIIETTAEKMAYVQKNNSNGFQGKIPTSFSYSGKGIELSNIEIKIMCAVICDGTFTNKNSNLCRFHIKKDRKKNRLRELFAEAKIPWKEHISSAEGYTDFYIYAPRKEKEFTSYWYNCNQEQLKIICDNIMFWDGNESKTQNNKIRRRFSTTNKNTADFVQFAYSSCGFRASIGINNRIGEEYITNNEAYIRKSIEYLVSVTERNMIGIGNCTSKEYQKQIVQDYIPVDGYKYCFTVPTGALVLRRNNQIFITGNCGKTVITKVFTSVYKQSGLSVALCTLSGKASARIQEATGFNGSTIHRLLGFVPDIGFKYNKDNPLPYDVIIVDESSFVGGELFYDLISAIKEGGKLILVGDDKQLPSIGMCNIFFDMINSKKIAMAKLTQIHRQAQKSGIIVASKMVREGTQLVKNGWVGKETRGELQDFTIDIYDNKLYSNPKIIEWYRHYVKDLPDTFKTQIIVPMKYRGDFNTFDLNNQIQAIFNPKNSIKKEILLTKNGKSFTIREGDKVINRKNNYHAIIYKEDNFKNNIYQQEFLDIDEYGNQVDNRKYTEIFNGFCGEVVKIIDNKIIVKFDLCGDLILFDYENRNNLELAYALTTHLFQGSQIENVIVGIDNGSYIMNTKELVYTAITRASKECVLLCEGGALKHAINTSQTNNKNTFLMTLLKQEQI